MSNKTETTAATIRAMADHRTVAYTPTASDIWARHITRLTGDEVALDKTELALLALMRAGHLTRPEMLNLQVRHLREVAHG
jgi:hypothetical protein